LIPKPRRQALGRGRGSVSMYPHGTDRQLLAMLEAKRIDRRASEIAWRLWCQDFPVRFEYIRERLLRAAEELDAITGELPHHLDDEAALEAMLREAERGHLQGPAA